MALRSRSMERRRLSIAGEVRSPAIATMKATFILRSPPDHSAIRRTVSAMQHAGWLEMRC